MKSFRKTLPGKQAQDASPDTLLAATPVGSRRHQIPPGRTNPCSANILGKETSQTHLCLCHRFAVFPAGKYAVAIDSMTLSDKREPDVSSIAQLEPVFAGFRTIQANKSIHRSTLTELTHEGQLLREELDSLIAIPRKSHQDSIHIVQSYNRLESIVKSLQNNDHP